MANIREQSRQNWNGDGTIEAINSGSLQRIADATELMATKYRQMAKDLEWYTKAYREKRDDNERLRRSNAALRGVIKRMKKARS